MGRFCNLTALLEPMLMEPKLEPTSMLRMTAALIRRDLLLAWRRKSEPLTALLFFVVVASLFPLGIGAEPRLLRLIGPGVIWVSALLAALLSLPRVFAADFDDGTLEQLALGRAPFGLMTAAKIAAHWLQSGLPLLLLSPLLGLQFGLQGAELLVLAFSLLLGTPLLCLFGAIGAALTLGLRGAGALLALLILPLEIPVLIFGASAVSQGMNGLSAQGELSILAAMLCVASFFAPWATTAALRLALES